MIKKLKHILCLISVLTVATFALCAITVPAFADTPTEQESAEITDSKGCKYSELQNKYMEGSTCWYCFVVGKMTGSYLYAASLVIPTVKTLALMILRYGFMIWLAFYILKQVSSLSPISGGKFLQEILIMGFKVMLATLIVNNGVPFLNEYIMTPIIDTGIDVGNSIFDEIAKVLDVEPQGGS